MTKFLLGVFVVVVGLVVLQALGIVPFVADVYGGLIDLGTDIEGMGVLVRVLAHA